MCFNKNCFFCSLLQKRLNAQMFVDSNHNRSVWGYVSFAPLKFVKICEQPLVCPVHFGVCYSVFERVLKIQYLVANCIVSIIMDSSFITLFPSLFSIQSKSTITAIVSCIPEYVGVEHVKHLVRMKPLTRLTFLQQVKSTVFIKKLVWCQHCTLFC